MADGWIPEFPRGTQMKRNFSFSFGVFVLALALFVPVIHGISQTVVLQLRGGDRITGYPVNLLEPGSALPQNYDALWLSQFLDCFSEGQIRVVLDKCRRSLQPEGRLFILEPLWDRQSFAAAAYSLQCTSLYFTALANGNSRMYDSRVLLALVRDAGFEITEQLDGLGNIQTLLVCRPV